MSMPVIKLRQVVGFPGNIVGGTGIEATKLNGTVTIDMQWNEFGLQSAIPTSPTNNILTFDTATEQYVMIPSSLLGGAASGIADAPNNGTQYGRQSGTWTPVLSGGLADAPSDGTQYGRKNAAWTAVTSLTDAPSDGTRYSRQNGAWAAIPPAGIGDAPSDGTQYGRINATWTPVVASNFIQAGTGAVTRTMQNKAREGFSVKDFGATGNGSTDDTAAIQAAVTALSAGGKLIVPPGDYKLSSRITIYSSNVEIEFARGARFVAASSAHAPDTMIGASNCSGLRLRGLTLVGNGATPSGDPGTSPSATFFQACHDLLIEDWDMTGFMGIGITISGCNSAQVLNSRFVNMGEDQTGTNLLVPPTGQSVPALHVQGSKYVTIRHSYFETIGASAIQLFGQNCLVEGNYFYNIGESAIYSENVDPAGNQGVEVIFNRYIGNTINTVRKVWISAAGFEVATHDTVIANNQVLFAATHGIGCGGGSRNVVIGNLIRDCNTAGNPEGAGIIAVVHGFGYNSAASQGDSIIVANNTIIDELGNCNYGIYWYADVASGYGFRRCVCQGNTIYGMVVADIYADPGALQGLSSVGDACVMRNNTSWPDYVVLADAPTSTSSLTEAILKSYVIPAGSMMNGRAVRLTAWGTFTGSATKYARIEFGGFTGFATAFGSTGTENWRIEGVVCNTSTTTQTLQCISWVGGAVSDNSNFTKAVDTTVNFSVYVTGQCTSGADSVICNGFIVERL